MGIFSSRADPNVERREVKRTLYKQLSLSLSQFSPVRARTSGWGAALHTPPGNGRGRIIHGTDRLGPDLALDFGSPGVSSAETLASDSMSVAPHTRDTNGSRGPQKAHSALAVSNIVSDGAQKILPALADRVRRWRLAAYSGATHTECAGQAVLANGQFC